MTAQDPETNELPKAPPAPEQQTYDKDSGSKVPSGDWPGAFGLYKFSKQTIRANLSTFLALVLVFIGVSLLLSSFGDMGSLLSGVVSIIFEVALIAAYLASSRGQQLSFSGALQASKPVLWVKYFLNSIVVGFALIGSLLLLIVPFFFVLPRVIFAPYFLIDKGMGPLEAIGASWNASKGHSGKVWGIIGAGIVMALPIFTIIGLPFSIYFLFMYQAAFALAYLYITKQPDNLKTEPAASPTE